MSPGILTFPYGPKGGQALQRLSQPLSGFTHHHRPPAAPAMGSTSQKAVGMSGEIDNQLWRKALQRRHAVKTAMHVEAATGVSRHTVQKWLDGVCAPSAAALVALIGAYGPGLLLDIMPKAPGWLDAAARAEETARLKAEHAQLVAQLNDLEARCAR